MAAEGAGGIGNAAALMPEMMHYNEQTRYSKMCVDWDNKNCSWNIRDAIGPLRATVLGGGPAFDVEVDCGERKQHPRELIRAVSSFRSSIEKAGILG